MSEYVECDKSYALLWDLEKKKNHWKRQLWSAGCQDRVLLLDQKQTLICETAGCVCCTTLCTVCSLLLFEYGFTIEKKLPLWLYNCDHMKPGSVITSVLFCFTLVTGFPAKRKYIPDWLIMTPDGQKKAPHIAVWWLIVTKLSSLQWYVFKHTMPTNEKHWCR